MLHAQAPSSSPPPVKLSGYIQGRETYQENVGLVGTINRARLTAAGGVAGNVTWRIQGEFRTGNVGTGRASVSLTDGYVRWTHNALGVQLGQFKTPFTWEYVTSLTVVETADRSTVVDSLAPKRDIGLMADYAIGGRATISAGIFNGEGQNVTANTDSSALGVARVTYRPIPYLVLGANAARYFADSTRYGVDASVESPWIILRGEYIGQHRDAGGHGGRQGLVRARCGAGATLAPAGASSTNGSSAPASHRPARSKNRAWTAGVNLFPWGRATRLTLEYVSRKVGDPGVRKSLGLAQAQVIF